MSAIATNKTHLKYKLVVFFSYKLFYEINHNPGYMTIVHLGSIFHLGILYQLNVLHTFCGKGCGEAWITNHLPIVNLVVLSQNNQALNYKYKVF